jgi:hypothetical protein
MRALAVLSKISAKNLNDVTLTFFQTLYALNVFIRNAYLYVYEHILIFDHKDLTIAD